MSKMKHLLRKLHIGGGGGGAGGAVASEHHHHHRLGESRTIMPPASVSSTTPTSSTASSSLASPAPSATSPAESRTAGEGGSAGARGGGGGEGDFSYFEEEYQVQLALAISASDPDGLEDPDSVQIKAAKRMSLGCAGVPNGSGGGDEKLMEFLSLRYWTYNVVNYDEKLTDGFYDVYGIVSNLNLQGKMPSLVELEATTVSENADYEVVIVNRSIDQSLQELERRAKTIASESRVEHIGPFASDLVQKLANLVVDCMGGPVVDADDVLRRWTMKSYELRNSLNSIVLPLGLLKVGLSRHRALLFKVLADWINLPCRLVKGSYYTGSDEGAVNLIKVDYDSEYIIDLMGAPGTLIPVESPSCHLRDSGASLLSSDTSEQTVKDLCFALDTVNFQLQKPSEISEGGSDTAPSIIELQIEERSGVSPETQNDDANVSEKDQTERFEEEFGRLLPALGGPRADNLGAMEATSPAQQMKVNDVSKYVVSAARNPEFAQKLHAVLLESGASPPPDLFSDLSPSGDMVEKRDRRKGICLEGREWEEGQSPLNFPDAHPPVVAATEAESSSCFMVRNEHQNFAAETNRMQGKNADIYRNPFMPSSYLPSVTSEGLVSVQNGINDVRFADFQTKGPYPVSDAVAVTSASSIREQINNSLVCSEADTRSRNFVPVLNDVAEWEIQWEDLQIGERIGLGSCGEVYRADWNGTEVAVKKFLEQDLPGDALVQFRYEVGIMLRLRHPNVVLFMGAVTRPPNLSILTEFLPRGSLYRLLHRPNIHLDEKRRLKMALDVAKGMNYLHTRHPTIVHRDLKSPNLLVDKNWAVKVCDFGLSRLKHNTFLSSKSTAGTPEWMAPEVLRNEPSNEKCDVYSFGVILWELATLCMPWSGMNPMQVVGAVGFQDRRLDIPTDVDPAVAQIINDCWQREPNLRPSFAQLLSPLRKLQRLVVPSS